MKKLVCLVVLLLTVSASLSAFSNREHSTVATIAEKYMSRKAKKAVNEILKGESMVTYAVYPDVHRKDLLRDGEQVPHTFPVAEDLNSLDFEKKSAVVSLENAINELKDWKNLDEQRRFEDLVIVIHLVGDIHCPSHVGEPKKASSLRPKKYVNQKDTIRFHQAWDSYFVAKSFVGGNLELAQIADVATPKQRAEFQKGTPADWALENFKESYPFTHDTDMPESRIVTVDRPYMLDHALHAKRQVMKAGYRLAKVLNDLFK